uniref:Kelch like family member 8 n=1 Tax=Calidris pygmaea TaxID=425635 RepID=A0A8C3KW83_9CHAR
MASESMVPEQAKQHVVKGKRWQQQQQTRSSNSDGEDDIFVFEANESWKDFHSSLLHFFEAGELCDVTLKSLNTQKTNKCLPVSSCLPDASRRFLRMFHLK